MKIDLHFHAALSKKIGFELDFFQETIKAAQAVGLDALALTEHFNSRNFEDIYPSLDQKYDYVGDYYLVDGLRLFLGLEIDVTEGGHILVIGPRDAIRAYHRLFIPNLEAGSFCPAEELLERQAGFDFLTIYAHPFRPRREVTNLPPSLYDRLDALDLNAKDLCNFGTEMRQRLETFGSQCGLPIVAGSDTHHPHQLGVVYNLFEQPFETVADLKALIQRGAYMLHIDKELPLKVRAAEEAKAILKRQKLIA